MFDIITDVIAWAIGLGLIFMAVGGMYALYRDYNETPEQRRQREEKRRRYIEDFEARQKILKKRKQVKAARKAAKKAAEKAAKQASKNP